MRHIPTPNETTKYITLLILICTISLSSFSQGCNDAGLCTFGNNGGGQLVSSSQNNLVISQSIALGDQNTFLATTTLLLNYKLNQGIKIQMASPFTLIKGNLGNTAGLGDLVLGINKKIMDKGTSHLSVSLGGKLKANKGNKTLNNEALPMVYQTSMGTNDIIVGANYFVNNWHFGIGFQKAITQSNNAFNHNIYNISPEQLSYPESYFLKRGEDIMLRIERNFEVGNGFLFIGLNPIYRLNEDQIEIKGKYTPVQGTKGLTLNANASYLKEVKNNNIIRITSGAPMITRDVRIDGLTRTFVIALDYIFNFKPEYKLNKNLKPVFQYQN